MTRTSLVSSRQVRQLTYVPKIFLLILFSYILSLSCPSIARIIFHLPVLEMHLLEGPDEGISTYFFRGKSEKKEEKRKKTAPGGNRTHNLLIISGVLYRCATTAD